MLDALKQHSAAIQAQRDVIAALQADHDRVTEAAAMGDDAGVQLVALRQRRNDEIGQAFLDKREPDLKALDAEIAKTDKRSAEAVAAAAAARAALPLVIAKQQAAQAELQRLLIAQIEQGLVLAREDFDAKLEAYEAECDAVLARLVDVSAAAWMVNALARRLTGTDGGAGAKGLAHHIADQLRLAQRDARGLWSTTFGESTARSTGLAFAQVADSLTAAGIDLNGPALKPPTKESNAPTEQRPVTVTTIAANGQADVRILSEAR